MVKVLDKGELFISLMYSIYKGDKYELMMHIRYSIPYFCVYKNGNNVFEHIEYKLALNDFESRYKSE